MNTLFEIKKKDDSYCFEVQNEAGQHLFSSVPFSAKNEIEHTLAQLKASSNTVVFERKTNYEGRFQFNLKTIDRGVLGNSTLFQSQVGMENGIKQMKNHLASYATEV